ncbi:glycosyltransferase family 39 protein [Botrimarina sp.]|uniref:glycosyltransferase family 39 protein n=1 Tax=Botrimarina sp. TaxID=2795802 RepID=UPI0032ED179B
MPRSREWLCLAAIVAASLALHAATLTRQSLFVDEASQLLQARGTLHEVALRRDSMPPTYLLMLRGWVTAAGEGAHARWLSVLASLATIPVVWRIGRRAGGAAAIGVAAAAAFAALPMQLFYAQLVRGYALTTLAAAMVIAAYLRAVDSGGRRDWALVSLCGIAGMWVHYYFAIVLLLLFVDLLLRAPARRTASPYVAAVAIVVGCLPLAPFLQADFQYQRDLRDPRPFDAGAAAYTALSWFSGYTLGPSKPELHQIGGAAAAAAAAPWLAAVAIAATPLLVFGARRLAATRSARVIALLVLAPAPLLGLLGAASGITYNPRFVAWCVTPLSVWLGAGVVAGVAAGRWKRPVTLASTAVLVAVALFALYNRHAVSRYQNEDLGGAAAWLAEHAEQGQTVFILSDYLAPTLRLHAQIAGLRLPKVVELPAPGAVDTVADDRADAEQAAAVVANAPRPFWLIECRTFHGDPRRLVHDALASTNRLTRATSFAGVVIWRGE